MGVHLVCLCHLCPCQRVQHEWMGGRGAEHVKHAHLGVFYVFKGGTWSVQQVWWDMTHEGRRTKHDKMCPSGHVFSCLVK